MDPETCALVEELRSGGLTPKAIARRLALRPAAVASLTRGLAARRPSPPSPPRTTYISPGWSEGLGLHGEAAQWREFDSGSGLGHGLVTVLWAHERPGDNVTVCCCLVDVYCLGVKDSLGPRDMRAGQLRALMSRCFEAYGAPPIAVPLELVRSLVLGAVDYARALGFAPHPDFALARPSLGEWSGRCSITFGQNGKPFFVQGPRDDAVRVMRTLRRSVGDGNFDFIHVSR
jgi:hypothetical protein